jgi:hypothetical protein
LLPQKSNEARELYANEAYRRNLGVRDLRKLISRKTYVRQEVANMELAIPHSMNWSLAAPAPRKKFSLLLYNNLQFPG